jgi:hypothetical protein
VKHPMTRRGTTPAEARAMYQRTMNGWIMDSLRLGRRGLERPSARPSAAPPASRGSLFTFRRGDTRAVG